MCSESTRSFVARIVCLCSVAVPVLSKESLANDIQPHIRIINGEPISIKDVPHTVQITQTHGIWVCGGSLVSNRFVVTAAHCFDGLFAYELQVIAGTEKRDNYGTEATKANVSQVFIHPGYEQYQRPAVNFNMDVAVLKLAEPIAFNETIQPIAMCTDPLQPGEKIQIVGWGNTMVNGVLSDKLMSVDVPVYSDAECLIMHEDTVTKITRSMVCAGEIGIRDSCKGDSGGPAIRKSKLCGIVSWGVGCADKKHVGIYTSIPVVRDFIDKCMSGEIQPKG